MTVDSFSALPLAETLRLIANGDLAPFIKSEPAPQVPELPGHVTQVVATTFEELVSDQTKDVLLGLYTTERINALQEVHALHKPAVAPNGDLTCCAWCSDVRWLRSLPRCPLFV